MPGPVCVVTSINHPTPCVREWESRFHDNLLVVGDKKTPADWSCGRAQFLSIEAQSALAFESTKHTPINHYARKNIGYLMAMQRPITSAIFDTDDDNRPSDTWVERAERCVVEVVPKSGWCNAYALMHGKNIWPRGFPLSAVAKSHGPDYFAAWTGKISEAEYPIQQGLADRSPDVDAIWRLILPEEVSFWLTKSVGLPSGTWCPFNSQATWWFPSAFPLMYLPIRATFRMTDIWRSFVAQRCLWAMGKGVAFHSPAEVVQDRNEHNLLADFESEIPGYLHNEAIAKALGATELASGSDVSVISKNLRMCYEAMVAGGFLPADELKSVDAWIADVRRILTKPEYKELGAR